MSSGSAIPDIIQKFKFFILFYGIAFIAVDKFECIVHILINGTPFS